MYTQHKVLFFVILGCLRQNAYGSEIINGEKAPENSMQYMASLQKNGRHVCGGFLISKKFVLTAAHCDIDKVVLGTHDLKKTDKTERGVEKTYRHSQFVNVGHGKDIMLLKLSSEVCLNNRIKEIKLAKSDINLKDNETCNVAGWGFTNTGGNPTHELKVVNVSIINPGTCNEIWSDLPANVICAGGYNTDKGFCQGDSGGPLVCNGVAVGIVSFNRHSNCSYPDVPNVYTDVSKYLPWINKILNE